MGLGLGYVDPDPCSSGPGTNASIIYGPRPLQMGWVKAGLGRVRDPLSSLVVTCIYNYMGEFERAKSGFEEIITKEPLHMEAFHGFAMAVSQGKKDGKELEEVTKRIVEAMDRCHRDKKIEEMREFKLLIAQIQAIEGN